jgi:26S proteasome regulatory subunit N8
MTKNALDSLDSHLKEIEDYLKQVVDGSLPQNHQILYNLQNMFNLLPNLSDVSLQKSFNVVGNDKMLIVYLSSIARSIVALHRLIDNKLENRDAEAIELGLKQAPAKPSEEKKTEEAVGK